VVQPPPVDDALQRISKIAVLPVHVNPERRPNVGVFHPGSTGNRPFQLACTCPMFCRIRDIAHPREFWARCEQPISESRVVGTGRFPAGVHIVPNPLMEMPSRPRRLDGVLTTLMAEEP